MLLAVIAVSYFESTNLKDENMNHSVRCNSTTTLGNASEGEIKTLHLVGLWIVNMITGCTPMVLVLIEIIAVHCKCERYSKYFFESIGLAVLVIALVAVTLEVQMISGIVTAICCLYIIVEHIGHFRRELNRLRLEQSESSDRVDEDA